MNDPFWINEPSILFRKDKILQIWPYEHMSIASKLNASTRFVILISLFGFMILNNYLILLFGVVLIVALVMLMMYMKKNYYESYQNSVDEDKKHFTKENPLNNVLMSDYVDNVDKKELKTPYNDAHEDEINKSVKHFVLENNKENKDIGSIFKNVENNLEFVDDLRSYILSIDKNVLLGRLAT